MADFRGNSRHQINERFSGGWEHGAKIIIVSPSANNVSQEIYKVI